MSGASHESHRDLDILPSQQGDRMSFRMRSARPWRTAWLQRLKPWRFEAARGGTTPSDDPSGQIVQSQTARPAASKEHANFQDRLTHSNSIRSDIASKNVNTVPNAYLRRPCVLSCARVAGGDFWNYRRSWELISVTTDLAARSRESY